MGKSVIHILAFSTAPLEQGSLLRAAVARHYVQFKPDHPPGCGHRRLFFWCAPVLGLETSLLVPTGPGGRSRAGLTAKKLAGFSWKPTVSTGIWRRDVLSQIKFKYSPLLKHIVRGGIKLASLALTTGQSSVLHSPGACQGLPVEGGKDRGQLCLFLPDAGQR